MSRPPAPSPIPLRWPATLITVALMTAVLVACGGGGGSASPAPQQPADGAREGALSASRPGELLAYVKARLAERLAQRQATPDVMFVTGIAATTSAPTVGEDTGSRSGTVVQEAGVDEDDTIKTDGNVIWTLTDTRSPGIGKPAATLKGWRRAADGSVSGAGSLGVTVSADAMPVSRGMLWVPASQRAAVIGESQTFQPWQCGGDVCATLLPVPNATAATVHVDLVNTANAASPALIERWAIDGRLVGSRLIGNRLVLVTQHAPPLAVDALPVNASQADRDALVARLTVADVLPTLRINDGARQPLVAETDCYVQAKNASPGIDITVFTVVDLSAATPTRTTRCFAGGSEAMYMSPSSLYVATTRYAYTATSSLVTRLPSGITTDLHKFALDGGALAYRGSGEAQGHLGWDVQRKSYRLSEWNGDLRVLTYTANIGWGPAGATAGVEPSPAQLTILRERASDQTLQVVSTLPNAQRPATLGKPREQVYGVRFVGSRGYVVTFQRTDPLYVLDLSNPADPKTVGELEVSGYSDYLFPITETLLLGVGHDADARGQVSGVKVALIDLTDATRPRQVDSRTWGGAPSQSGLDASRHGIDILPQATRTRVALPLLLRADYSTVPSTGLQRIEIDHAARKLDTSRALIPGALGGEQFYADRSVQIDNRVYYFNAGALTVHDW